MIDVTKVCLGDRVKVEFWGEVMGIDQRRVEIKSDGCASGVWAIVAHSEIKESLGKELTR